jgi:hypothetical protein
MTAKENAPAMTRAQGNTTPADSTRIARLKTIAADHPGNDVELQRDRVLAALREGLRIDTVWSLEPTECGLLHRMARYVLRVGVAG